MRFEGKNRNDALLELAKARLQYKAHLFFYIIVMIVLWIVWFLSGIDITWDILLNYPIPIVLTLVWGGFVIIHYFEVYYWLDDLFDENYIPNL